MILENAEEPVFEPDGDPKIPWGTGGSNFWDARTPTYYYGDEIGDVVNLGPPHERVPTLVTRAQFKEAYAYHHGNLRAISHQFGFHQQTAVNYAVRWNLKIKDVGRPSELTQLLPEIAADREAGMKWRKLEEKYGFPSGTIKQALWRHRNE